MVTTTQKSEKANKILILIICLAFAFPAISLVYAVGTPPAQPPAQNASINDSQPLKDRLTAFYDAKELYINQKRQCKENAIITDAPSGTCWNLLKPVLIGLLQQQIELTDKRLIQLRGLNVTFPNIDEINATLNEARTIFADPDSSKYLIKSTASNLETLINQIEERALINQTEKLISQMDNLMLKADAITVKLDAELNILRAFGVDVTELENSLNDYKDNLAQTKEDIAAAKAKYAEMNSSEGISDLAREVREFINNANNYLVKAFDKANAMIPLMRNSEQGGDGNNNNNQTEGGTI
ncbi:Uncharacterised protein [Candidatus Tiddalikarchaeum anstoanum]|nr:Uncharacterised protein [Candidatus Tiddalikarchaeum anstoanum]